MYQPHSSSLSSKLFDIGNHVFLAVLALTCLLPIVHIFAVSFSGTSAAMANAVGLWPVDFHLEAYNRILHDARFFNAFFVSVVRTAVGGAITMVLILLTAYPLCMEKEQFRWRNVLMWVLFFPMLFKGGLIPLFIVVRQVGLIDTFWVLIVPFAVRIFDIIIMMNFFRGLPRAVYESAVIDGAGHPAILFRIYAPMSTAAIASLTMFAIVFYWNDWFNGLIFLNDSRRWPLQTLLSQMLVTIDVTRITKDDLDLLRRLNNRSLRSAQIFIAMLPILIVYPFLQRFFVKGIVIGSVKG